MKKRNIWLTVGLMAGCVWTSCTTEPSVAENEFLIEGTLENVADGEVLYLCRVEDGALIKVARDTLEQGHFSFRDTISHTRLYNLYGISDHFASTWVDVWLAPGKKVTVTGDDPYLRTWKVESDIQEQKDQNILLEAVRAEWKEKGRNTVEQNKWYRLGQEAKNDSIRQMARMKLDSLKMEEEKIEETMTPKELAALEKMPIGRVWFNEYVHYAQSLAFDPNSPYVDEIKALYNRLSESEKQTPEGKKLGRYMNLPKAVQVGDAMADADLYDVNGEVHHLAELKGKSILLDFWFVGCGACIMSEPELKAVAERYKEQLSVVSICISPEAVWKKYVLERSLEGNQWNDPLEYAGLAAAYQIQSYPTYILISPEGMIEEIWNGYSEGALEKKMEKLFKGK